MGRGPPGEPQGAAAPTQAQHGQDGDNPFAGRKCAATAQEPAVSAEAKYDPDGSTDEDERREEGPIGCGGDSPSRRTEKAAVAAVPEPSRASADGVCPSESPAGQADNEKFRLARRRQQQEQQQQQQQQQRRRSTEGVVGTTVAPRGKCLVVCPTGAEASVIVCLCALVAFFPPPPATANATSRTASADDRDQPQSPPTSSPKSFAAVKTTDDGDVGQYLGGGSFKVLRRRSAAAAVTADVLVTKAQLRWRFLLVQQECPWARPPRRLMQELNEYFMTPGEHSWWTLSDRLSEEPVGFDGGT